MSIFNKTEDQDNLARNMQDEAIKVASTRLGYSLPEDLISKIRQKKWGLMGLEMIIDTVRTIDVPEIRKYPENLE